MNAKQAADSYPIGDSPPIVRPADEEVSLYVERFREWLWQVAKAESQKRNGQTINRLDVRTALEVEAGEGFIGLGEELLR